MAEPIRALNAPSTTVQEAAAIAAAIILVKEMGLELRRLTPPATDTKQVCLDLAPKLGASPQTVLR